MAQVEFRDGIREIPDHLRDMMAGIPTHTLTFEQAVAQANRNLERGVIDRASDAIIQQHGREFWGQR